MIRAMLFVDGSWWWSQQGVFRELMGNEDYRIDYGKLRDRLANELARQVGAGRERHVDLVRTYLFRSVPRNVDPRDAQYVEAHERFFNMLKREFNYEIRSYPIDFRGTRFRRQDRQQTNQEDPKEQQLEVGLAVTAVCLREAYDVAIVVLGDGDFVPALKQLRLDGKRVMIASCQKSCSKMYADYSDSEEVRDFDVVWLDDAELLDEIKLEFRVRRVDCQADEHEGDRGVVTRRRPNVGEIFFCDPCRESRQEWVEAIRQRRDVFERLVKPRLLELLKGRERKETEDLDGCVSGILHIVNRKVGLVMTKDELTWSFEPKDLSGIEWDEMDFGDRVRFDIASEGERRSDRKAKNVRFVERAPGEEPT